MSTMIPTQTEKCKGAMLATAIGDALGWPNEPRAKNRMKHPKVTDHFVTWTRSSNSPRWHDERILPGEYSDDTQLTLSVARSIIAGDWEKFLTEKELPFWLNYERGGGGALLRAAKAYREGSSLWQSRYARNYFNAGGNGAAMRILPHVIAAAKTPNTTELMTKVTKDTSLTHGHPRAFLGATCYAYALDYLLRKETVLEYGALVTAVIDGEKDWGAPLDPNVFGPWLSSAKQHSEYDFPVVWENTRANMRKQLAFISASLKRGLILDDSKVLTELECFGPANGAGDVAALAAIYLASRYANNPPLGIKIPAFLFGADTDTIASMTGGLLGMLSGTNWIPLEWRSVQDYDCLLQMAELLLADNKKEAVKEEVAEANAQDNQWGVTPIGKMRCVDSERVPNGKHGMVVIEKWKTMLGQTLYQKSFQPNETSPQPRQSENQIQDHQQVTLYDGTASATSPVLSGLSVRKTSRQFVLTSESVAELLGDPKFKTNITVGKVLKILTYLMDDKKTVASIAKQFRVERSMVEQMAKYVIPLG